MDRLDLFVAALEAAHRFPRIAGALGGAVAAAARAARAVPVLGSAVPAWLAFAPRLFLGREDALALHEIDAERGAISIGGVRQVVLGAPIFRVLHEVLRERLGEAGAVPVLYEIGRRTGAAGVQELRRSGAWLPPPIERLAGTGALLERVRRDPRAARIAALLFARAAEVVVAGGGIGKLRRLDFGKDPIEIELERSLEAATAGPAAGPVCHIHRGFFAGWSKELLGDPVAVDETACAAAGAMRCAFAVRRVRAAGERQAAGAASDPARRD